MDYTDFQVVFLVVGKFRIGCGITTAPLVGVEAVNIHGIRAVAAFDASYINARPWSAFG